MNVVDLQLRYTRHQVARGTRPDAESGEVLYLIKFASSLRLTYQIRLLTYFARESRRKLVLRIRRTCEVDADLDRFAKEHSQIVKIERFDA
jgi:hypothetical protein